MDMRIAGAAIVALLVGAVPETSPGELRYIANAGVMVTLAEGRVLIDAPIRDGIPPYATSSDAERMKLERALPPYDAVDALLITHWHEDHFSAEAVAAHLGHNSRAVLVSSPEVVARVKAVAPSLPEGRFRAVLPSPGTSQLVTVGKLPIHVLRIRHNPTRRLPEQHLGFLVGAARTVLHTGDADPQADNFEVLRRLPRVDTAVVPFWYLLEAAQRTFVADAIAPNSMVAMHVPPADAATVTKTLADANVRATLLVTPGMVR